MNRPLGRVAAAVLLLCLYALPAAVAIRAGERACAMCARHCCCKPVGKRDVCRLSRSCAAGDEPLQALPGLGVKAILAAGHPAGDPPAHAGWLCAGDPVSPRGPDVPPPVPPPRAVRV